MCLQEHDTFSLFFRPHKKNERPAFEFIKPGAFWSVIRTISPSELIKKSLKIFAFRTPVGTWKAKLWARIHIDLKPNGNQSIIREKKCDKTRLEWKKQRLCLKPLFWCLDLVMCLQQEQHRVGEETGLFQSRWHWAPERISWLLSWISLFISLVPPHQLSVHSMRNRKKDLLSHVSNPSWRKGFSVPLSLPGSRRNICPVGARTCKGCRREGEGRKQKKRWKYQLFWSSP